MTPSTEAILTVNNVSWFEVHPPVKILGFGHVRSNLERLSINIDSSFLNIVKILNLEVRLVDNKDFSSTPNELIILTI